MKKLLLLSLLTYSVFSMQLVTIKETCLKAQAIHHKLTKHHSFELNETKKNRHKAIEKQPVNDLKELINSSSVVSSQSLGEVKLFHNEKGFHVLHNDEMHQVQPAFTDVIVRKATTLEMKDFQKVNKGYLHITQMADGKFEIKVMDRLPGGGATGAIIGAYIGRFGVYFLGHGAIVIASGLTGPFAASTFAGLEACFGLHIELASHGASIAGGMIGAVMSGPV